MRPETHYEFSIRLVDAVEDEGKQKPSCTHITLRIDSRQSYVERGVKGDNEFWVLGRVCEYM